MYHDDGSLPKNTHDCWVFGSNLAGVHGAGAAKVAHELFERPYGDGVGYYVSPNLQSSYAIPTKGFDIETLSLDEIQVYVDKFVLFTYENPNKQFFITAIGTGLAGYRHSDIAPMFIKCNSNCSFPNQWGEYLSGN